MVVTLTPLCFIAPYSVNQFCVFCESALIDIRNHCQPSAAGVRWLRNPGENFYYYYCYCIFVSYCTNCLCSNHFHHCIVVDFLIRFQFPALLGPGSNFRVRAPHFIHVCCSPFAAGELILFCVVVFYITHFDVKRNKDRESPATTVHPDHYYPSDLMTERLSGH